MENYLIRRLKPIHNLWKFGKDSKILEVLELKSEKYYSLLLRIFPIFSLLIFSWAFLLPRQTIPPFVGSACLIKFKSRLQEIDLGYDRRKDKYRGIIQ